jgi:hypothetical protein
MIKKPILLTGSPRSGSTWTGKMLSVSNEVTYLHEPFNPYNYRRGRCSAFFKYFFTYVCDVNEHEYKNGLAELLQFKYQWSKEFPLIKTPRDIGRTIRDSSRYALYRRQHARPLIKDPIAVFSAPWLAETFNMDVVMMIRHPAAFAWSIKKKGEVIRFSEMLNQPLLMDAYLEPYRSQMEAYRNGASNRVDEACLLWCLVYSVVQKYREKYPQWIYLRHEDLSKDTMTGFEDLFARLNLSFTSQVAKQIRQYTVDSKRSKIVGGNNIRLDSKKNITSWKGKLCDEEVSRVYEKTKDVSQFFYDRSEWA